MNEIWVNCYCCAFLTLTFWLFSLLSTLFPSTCLHLRVHAGFQDYVTVGQLNQIYGMPKVDSSPTSPAQLHQRTLNEPAFSCLPSLHGSSLSISFEVCPFTFESNSTSSSCFVVQ